MVIMKLNITVTIIIMTCMSTSATNAQALKEKHLNFLTEQNIELIDSNKLYNKVLRDNGKVKMVAIFTNNCAGTPHLFKTISEYREKFGDKLEFILCSSASRKQLDEMLEVLKVHSYTDKVYFVDPAQYKEYGGDDRKKGFSFRNDICTPCREDVIGVPYKVFFGPNKEVLFHGYETRKDFKKLLTEYFEGH